MDLVKDILVNDLGELQFKAGDLEIGESDYQHVNHILRSKPGYYRKHPLLGVNVRIVVPIVRPVTKPLASKLATAGLLLTHSPSEVGIVFVVVPVGI